MVQDLSQFHTLVSNLVSLPQTRADPNHFPHSACLIQSARHGKQNSSKPPFSWMAL
jgi:hypothetical protein